MRNPHREQKCGADETELDRDREYLTMGVGGAQFDRAAVAPGRAPELFADRAGAVTEHRRIGDECDRLAPEFQPQAEAGVRYAGVVVPEVRESLGRAQSQDR